VSERTNIVEAISRGQPVLRFGEILRILPTFEEAQRRYAETMGRPPLTDAERRQAYVDAVLEDAESE
jgi:hypothetical protein